jgi:hypothetical protein
MTTIAGTTATTRPEDRLLRVVLRVDAIASGMSGLGFLGTKEFLGLPWAFALPTGVLLLVFAAGVWLAASPRVLSTRAVATIIGLNLAWVIASVVVLVAGLLPLTTLGVAYAIAQAVAVAVLADLEYMGLRKIAR